MNELLTVFTPTYNRAQLLPFLYESLKKQVKKNFIWLIIDDGSTDNTRDLVFGWMADSYFEIQYHYQSNQGLSAGYNAAIKLIHTELSVCMDSDDIFFDEYTTSIIEISFKKYAHDKSIAGIVGMDAVKNGTILGNPLKNGELIDFLTYQTDKKERADKKIVVRTECYKCVIPVTTYPDEKGISPHILHMRICEKYHFIAIDSCLCIVNYQPDGMSHNIWRQYFYSPKSFADLRKYCLLNEKSGVFRKIIVAMHYDACCILSKRSFVNAPKWYLTWPMIPAGFLLSIIIRIKGENS